MPVQRYPPVVMSRHSQSLPFTVVPSTTSILPYACACPVALHAQVLVLLGCPPTVISRQSGEPFGMYEVGVLMYSTIIVTVHLQV